MEKECKNKLEGISEELRAEVRSLHEKIDPLSRLPLEVKYIKEGLDRANKLHDENSESLHEHMARTAANEARLKLMEDYFRETIQKTNRTAETKGYIVGFVAVFTIIAALISVSTLL